MLRNHILGLSCTQGDVMLPGKRLKLDTDPIQLSTNPRQLAALRTALAPLPPPAALAALPARRVKHRLAEDITLADQMLPEVCPAFTTTGCGGA